MSREIPASINTEIAAETLQPPPPDEPPTPCSVPVCVVVLLLVFVFGVTFWIASGVAIPSDVFPAVSDDM